MNFSQITPNLSGESYYNDVEEREMTLYINHAFNLGWINDAPQFRPNDPITYFEIQTILMRKSGESMRNYDPKDAQKTINRDEAVNLIYITSETNR